MLGVMCIGQATPLDMLMYYDARPCGMNGIFESAQTASQQYLDNLKALSHRREVLCVQRENECGFLLTPIKRYTYTLFTNRIKANNSRCIDFITIACSRRLLLC